jgi:hypothetical protein
MIERYDEIGYPAAGAGETYEDETPTVAWADFRSSAGTRAEQRRELERTRDEEIRLARLAAAEIALRRTRAQEARRASLLVESW